MDRIVLFSIRAFQAHHVKSATSSGFVSYMQTTFGAGYISVGPPLVNVLRAWLVHTTQGQTMQSETPDSSKNTLTIISIESVQLAANRPDAEPQSQPVATLLETRPDDPQRRFWYRRISEVMMAAFVTAYTLAIVSGALYTQAENNSNRAQLILRLR